MKSCDWTRTLAPNILQLERTREVFEKIQQDVRLSYSLPRPYSLPGAVLKHVYSTVDSVVEKHRPLVFKVGFTHDAHNRFYNAKYGYIHDRHDRWQHMMVLFVSEETVAPSFVEAALIQRHKGT